MSERERETLIRLKMSKFEMCHFFLQSAALLLLRVENRINYCKQLFLSHSLTFRLPIVSTNGNKSILTYAIIHLPLAIVLSRTFKAYLKSLRGLLEKVVGGEEKIIEGAIKEIIDVGCNFIKIFQDSLNR